MILKKGVGSLVLVVGLMISAPGFGEGEATRPRVFAVEGMTCALCGKAIEKSLRGIEGVHDVRVDQKAQRVIVATTPEVGTAPLVTAIESAGSYTATPLEPSGG
ncbi:MAG: heavy metal-associated domain-containing protein [Myxococcota bacterium]